MNAYRAAAFLIFCTLAYATEPGRVRVERVPDGGMQPQAAVDAQGTVHLVYYKGDTMAGDLFYVRSTDGGLTFSTPVPVNSHPGSAIAAGNIRGARMALGRNGRVYVAWNGSKKAEPAGPNGSTPMLFTRLDDSGKSFEPERNVITSAFGLDGGGALAADRTGHVFVFWHAPTPGMNGEANRRVWVARSNDDGAQFAAEAPVSATGTGACGCCGMSGFADERGNVYVLYRSAREVVHRDMYLLTSSDHGSKFRSSEIDPWQVGACVMSTASFASAGDSVYAAWETKGQIHFGALDAATATVRKMQSAPGESGNRKHPSIAVNKNGEVLLAWTEGMGWKKGGTLAWQVYDKDGNVTPEAGRADGVPAFSLVSAFANRTGGFTILY